MFLVLVRQRRLHGVVVHELTIGLFLEVLLGPRVEVLFVALLLRWLELLLIRMKVGLIVHLLHVPWRLLLRITRVITAVAKTSLSLLLHA